MSVTTKATSILRVLVVKDQAIHRDLIRRCLEAGGREQVEFTAAGTVEEARAKIERGEFDCILLDHSLPDGTGWDILTTMEHRLLTTPVIGLSTSGDPEIALGDFRRGCAEFLTKHEAFRNNKLRQRLCEAIENHRRRMLASAARGSVVTDTIDKLVVAARIDALTGVLNRAVFDDALDELHDRPRGEAPYAVALIDIDNFKKYNDEYGHPEGDRALRLVAKAIQEATRQSDFVARYGGEEFAVLLSDVNEAAVPVLLSRVRDAVLALQLTHAQNPPHNVVTVSIGGAVYGRGDDNTDSTAVLRTADEALYVAKGSGRNTVVVRGAHNGAGPA